MADCERRTDCKMRCITDTVKKSEHHRCQQVEAAQIHIQAHETWLLRKFAEPLRSLLPEAQT